MNKYSEENLYRDLILILPEDRIKIRTIDRYAYASDASHFYLIPKAIVQPKTISEIQKIFDFSRNSKIHTTFRAGGTSLSGQGVTDGILIDLSRFWRKISVEQNGSTIRVEPGVIGGYANIVLKKFGRKIGPDPASINAAMMGGILANNSSGMCCGVRQNSYNTMRSIVFVLPNGYVFDSADPDSRANFKMDANEIYTGIARLRDEVRASDSLSSLIRRKYAQKNTVGYCLNAFLDFDDPLDIFVHLLIGSEGTLAFIAEAVLDTVPDLPYKATGLLYFDSPESACNAIEILIETKAAALEFMDRASLRSVEDLAGVPEVVKDLPPNTAAILIEYQEENLLDLENAVANAKPIFSRLSLIADAELTTDPEKQALIWKIRKGMYPSVAGMRARGTSAMLEDFTFPVSRLSEAVSDIQALFSKYGFSNGIIFGHAKDGNLHFVVSQSFAKKEEIEHYRRFNDELFELVLEKYDGGLKGEHSTGRAVTPFVESEWGGEAYAIMARLKVLVDPENLLNPGIIIGGDPNTYVNNLKSMPIVDPESDNCIECGFCESVCPSRDYTLTPRQRIGIRRAMKRLENTGDFATQQKLIRDFEFSGIETCATDGMCATNCPVGINTGELVKRLRGENHSSAQSRFARKVARNFSKFETLAKFGVRSGSLLNSIFGKSFVARVSGFSKQFIPIIPLWSNSISAPAKIKSTKVRNPSVIYFASCVSRIMGGEIVELFESICRKVGIEFSFVTGTSGACCGQIFSSKGFYDAFEASANKTIETLYADSCGGELPIVIDVTSCTQTLLGCRASLSDENRARFDHLRILDISEFAVQYILPKLNITKRKNRVVFHPTCSTIKLGLAPNLKKIGEACALEAQIPEFAGCCGMAGDRGFYFPDLTRAATKTEIDEISQTNFDGFYSTAKTCEIALSETSGKKFESILKLLDEVSG